MANHQFRRNNSAIDMVKGVVGADNSRRASRLRRQHLKTTAHLAAPAGFLAASIDKTGEYIRPSAKVAVDLGAKASAGDEHSKNSTETSPLNGGKQGWNHGRVSGYGSLNKILEDSVTTPLLGAPFYDSTTPSVFDAEHRTSSQHAKAAVYRWNKWIKLYISFLLAIFLTSGALIAMGKVAGSHREKAVEGGNGSTMSSAGTSTEAPNFWYMLAGTMAVGLADLILGGGLGEL